MQGSDNIASLQVGLAPLCWSFGLWDWPWEMALPGTAMMWARLPALLLVGSGAGLPNLEKVVSQPLRRPGCLGLRRSPLGLVSSAQYGSSETQVMFVVWKQENWVSGGRCYPSCLSPGFGNSWGMMQVVAPCWYNRCWHIPGWNYQPKEQCPLPALIYLVHLLGTSQLQQQGHGEWAAYCFCWLERHFPPRQFSSERGKKKKKKKTKSCRCC